MHIRSDDTDFHVEIVMSMASSRDSPLRCTLRSVDGVFIISVSGVHRSLYEELGLLPHIIVFVDSINVFVH